MKLSFISILLFFYSMSVLSQEKRHEFKIDALEALITPAIDITYEYAMSNSTALGVSTFFRIDKPDDDFKNFSITPYFRQYFFDNMNFDERGFYIEGFGQYTSGKREAEIINDVTTINDYNDIGIGFGVGYKLFAVSGFSVDANAGVGRNFGIESGSPDFFARWGIHLGYRFF